ncbi:MAG: tyrosine-type recombinase/integrase, partial [Treponema sp.]|nr:tyrosine-type recombinase/integrase [Treponema sp.]
RDLFSYCRKFNYISINVSLKLKNLKMPKQIPRFMTQKEVDDICIMPNENPLLWEKRDKAIVEVLYSTGCRVSEIENLKVRDISFDKKSAIVKGKGNKDRQVFFGADARKALEEYFVERKARFPLLDDSSSVFLNQRGGNLTKRGIALVLSRYSGVEGTNHHVSPHTFRHTFATAMLSNGADVRVIQEMLGHSQISTTQKYTHITQEQLIKTYNKAFPHGSRRHNSTDTDSSKDLEIKDSDADLKNKE